MLFRSFLGVGTISEAVIRAMCSRPGRDETLYLSPRSEARSRRLAEEYACCVRVDSNQAVLDASDIVVLAMRPQELDEALRGLRFRSDQIVASFIAGTPPSGIAEVVGPATRVCQLIPLPPISLHKGPLVICPGIPEVVAAFQGLGDVIVLDDETRIRVLSVGSAIMSTYFELQNDIIAWIAGHGIDEEAASLFIRSELEGLAAVGKVTPEESRLELPAEFQTKGGLNERVRAGLLAQGWFTAVTDCMSDTYDNANLRRSGD